MTVLYISGQRERNKSIHWGSMEKYYIGGQLELRMTAPDIGG